MATTIKLKNGSGVPTASDLVQGEPAFDLTNKRLYTEDSGGTVIEVGTNPSTLSINGTAITSTAAELNILDGVTATTAELNILDGVTATTTELNYVDGVTSSIQTQLDAKGTGTVSSLTDLSITATASELNILDGVTSNTAELNLLDGVTSTTDELNILDGVTSTAAELNLVDGSSAGTVVNSKAVVYSAAGEVKATTLSIGSWVIKVDTNELVFVYNGTEVFKVGTNGAVTSANDITAFGTI